MSTEFEWNLSQENIIRRVGGRSVEQLISVLKASNSTEFIHWRIAMRRHFEESLKKCPPTGRLQLYKKYIRWIEDYYPALGAPAKLGEVLYHCVRDVCHLEHISNQPDYLAIWLRLIPFCDHQSELFPLLLHHGIGQHCADFYVAWSNHLVKRSHSLSASDSSTKTIASILARGLREDAKPFSLIEDYIERFIYTIEHSKNLQSEKAESEVYAKSKKAQIAPTEARKTLASLRLIESVNTDVSEQNQWSVPNVRIGAALSENQRGLDVFPQNAFSIAKRRDAGLKIFCDPPSSSSNDFVPLFASSECSTPTLLIYADPSANIENIKPTESELAHQCANVASTASTSGCTGSALNLQIYRDPSPPLFPLKPTSLGSASSSSEKNPTSRGLQVSAASSSKAAKDRSPTVTFACIKAILMGQDVDDLSTQFSSLNTSEPSPSVDFFCDLELLSVDGEEKSFEVRKAENYFHASNPSTFYSNTPASFSPSLNDDVSRQLIQEIADIIANVGEDFGAHSPASTETDEVDARKLLMEQLLAISTGKNSNI